MVKLDNGMQILAVALSPHPGQVILALWQSQCCTLTVSVADNLARAEQDYRDELATPECKSQVHKLSERGSQDIRFDEPLADACYEDRNKLCDGVQPVSGPSPQQCLHVPDETPA